MTKEDRQLLLTDLCARLPYDVRISKVINTENETYISEPHTIKSYGSECFIIENEPFEDGLPDIDVWYIDEIKPYLRPMSSMTEEEKNEFIKFTSLSMHRFRCKATDTEHWFNTWEEEDYLDAHHFDYRRLIEKGLALEASKDMYKLK